MIIIMGCNNREPCMKKIPPGPGEEFWNLESSFEISVKTLSAMGR
jgi:hypothetical protein